VNGTKTKIENSHIVHVARAKSRISRNSQERDNMQLRFEVSKANNARSEQAVEGIPQIGIFRTILGMPSSPSKKFRSKTHRQNRYGARVKDQMVFQETLKTIRQGR
jgi:hypothetical protein